MIGAIFTAAAAIAVTLAIVLGAPLHTWESLMWVWIAVFWAAMTVWEDRP